MKHLKQSRASHRFIVVLLTLVVTLAMTITSFADVTVTKEWEDGLTGTAASSREAPTVNLEGATPYEQLLNIFYPVGSCYMSLDPSFNPNVAWGGTWQKLPAGMNVIQAGGNFQFGTTGGNKDAIVVAHKHTLYVYNDDFSNGGDTQAFETKKQSPGFTYDVALNSGKWSYTQMSTEGSSGTDANMQPYIAGNIWKRVA